MTGIDLAQPSIDVAIAHARADSTLRGRITYEATSAELLRAQGGSPTSFVMPPPSSAHGNHYTVCHAPINASLGAPNVSSVVLIEFVR